MSETIEPPTTPFARIGGTETISRIVNAFYDAMETNPDYAELRAMHAANLAPMRDSLTGFLTVWLGGPRDWLTQKGGFCIMSSHARLPITQQTAGQWINAMTQAIGTANLDPDFAAQLTEVLAQMAEGMVRD